MGNYRLVFDLILIVINLHLATSIDCGSYSKHDDIPFHMKVQQAPLIVIGSTLNKQIDINIPNLFNVTFLVRCILKGLPTQRFISIVQAGSLLGRRSCQRFDLNRDYIAFIEPFFEDTYRPVDFEEISYSNQVNLLLEKTCGLSRTYPFTDPNDLAAILTNKCPPSVSVDCPSVTPRSFIKTSTEVIGSTTIAIAATTTTTTTTPIPTTSTEPSTVRTTNSMVFSRSTIDFDLLSMMFAEHQDSNWNDDSSGTHNLRTLFSDDGARRNQANRIPCLITITHFIPFIICGILIFFL